MSEHSIAILYSDAHLLVVNKPAGLLSVPGRAPEHQDCLISRIQAQYPDALTVHRLDCHTSGLCVIARGKESQRALSRQFQDRKVSKTYLANVLGHVTDDKGSVELPLICDWPNRPLQMVDFENGKPALTHFQVVDRFIAQHGKDAYACSRVELTPVTGRSHQLRVHMLALGHPILGDIFYAPKDRLQLANRLHLHASQLSFYHPETGEWMSFDCCPDF